MTSALMTEIALVLYPKSNIWIQKCSIDEFQQTPSVEFNGNFSLLGIWKMEFQCKYAGNQDSQINLSKIRKS
jgi:hypothetical protein